MANTYEVRETPKGKAWREVQGKENAEAVAEAWAARDGRPLYVVNTETGATVRIGVDGEREKIEEAAAKETTGAPTWAKPEAR